MDIGVIATVILNAIVLGSVYLLMVLGLNVIFDLNRVLNMAHGAIYMVGAYIAYFVVAQGVNYFPALVIAILGTAILAVLVERSIIKLVRERPLTDTLIITFGLMFVLDGLIKFLGGEESHYFHLPTYLTPVVSFGGMSFPGNRLIVVGLTLAILMGLYAFIQWTRPGRVMRAASQIPDMVSCLGTNMRNVHIGTFALGCALAAAAGAVSAPLFPLYPGMGEKVLVIAFVVLVIGGIGNLKGAIIAAFLVGTTQSLSEFFIPNIAMVVVYLTMALVLAVTPRGLLGKGRLE